MISTTDLSIIMWNALKEKGATFPFITTAPAVISCYGGRYELERKNIVAMYVRPSDEILAPYFGAGGASNLLMAFSKMEVKESGYLRRGHSSEAFCWCWENDYGTTEYKEDAYEGAELFNHDEALLRLLCAVLKINRETGEKI